MAASTNVHGFNIGGNNNSFDQRGHFYRAFLSGNVSGMTVKQNSTPNMTVLVEHGSALLNKNTISASVAEIKSDTSVTIDTANTSNPRIDSIVIYEDTSVAIPTVEASYWQDGAGGRFKVVSLPGTAAASPVALSDASIQTAIGAGKPWTRLADITVPANSTTILNSNISDKRKRVSPSISNYGSAGVLTADTNGTVSSIPQLLGYAESVAETTAFATYVTVVSATVTIPAGVTAVLVTGVAPKYTNNNNGQIFFGLHVDNVIFQESQTTVTSGSAYSAYLCRRRTVTPGSTYTFTLKAKNDNNTLTVAGTSTQANVISVMPV